MVIEMDHPAAGKVRLIGSPMKFSGTPVEYRLPPPLLGEHTASVLKERLGLESGPDGSNPRRQGKPTIP